MLDLCLLGSGGVMPLHERWLTSLLFRYNGKMLLIDCGEGTQIPLKMAGWGFKAIDAICFTHYHGDHVAGLPGLLLTIGNSGRDEPIKLIGPPGLDMVVKGLRVIAPELPFELEIIELAGEDISEMDLMGLSLKSLPVDHTLPCLSYSIELKRAGRFDADRAKALEIPVAYWSRLQKEETVMAGDRTFTPDMVLGRPRNGIKAAYCTDTRPTAAIVDFIKYSDLFICEGMYGEEDKIDKAAQKKHMVFSEAALLAKQGHAKELWLTHYSPSMANPDEYIWSARNVFENTVTGKDLMTKVLRYRDIE